MSDLLSETDLKDLAQRGAVELEGAEPPAPGSKLAIDGRDAEITSAIYSPHFGKVIALAFVRAT